jgi:polysaccharide pyruvyl transferase WcaK-like protein
MKIAVFGPYGGLDCGDERVQYAIKRTLTGHTLVFLPHDIYPPVDLLKNFDWILIGGGGVLFERHGIWVDMKHWLRRTRARVGIIGLGVLSLTEMLREEVQELIQRSEFFFVRDQESKEMIGSFSKVEVRPDLTWLLPLRSVLKEKQTDRRLALNLAPSSSSDYDPNAWADAVGNESVAPLPLHYGPRRDFDLLRQLFPTNTPSEFDSATIAQCEAVIGCRYHAITFALQLRKPFIAIDWESRCERLLKKCGLQQYYLKSSEPNLLCEKLQSLRANRSGLLKQIDTYASQMESEGEAFGNEIRKLISHRARLKTDLETVRKTVQI